MQYTFARIQSILRKVGNSEWAMVNEQLKIGNQKSEIEQQLLPAERSLIILLEQYSTAVEEAGNELDPSIIANYIFQLAQKFNSFYAEHSVANAETDEKKQLRLCLSIMCANIIKSGMKLLGIEVPDKM